MAAVMTDMGEVDEIHPKEDTAKDKPVLNGDASSAKSSEVDETENKEDEEEDEEPMDVDEDNNTRETESNSAEANDDTNDNSEGNSEVHTVENSDDEVIDEIVDGEIADDENVDGENLDGEDADDGNVDDEDDTIDDKIDDKIADENVNDVNIDDKNDANDEENKEKDSEPIVLNDSGDADVEIIDAPKENGNSHKIDDDDDIITIECTSPKKNKKSIVISESPRRSARNANRRTRRSYNDDSDTSEDAKNDSDAKEESDIEEVLPEDPLADLQPPKPAPPPKKPVIQKSSTIVVKDTKRLAEIASKSSNSSSSGKKEPTLVIIDTNSILSGRGPVPVGQKGSSSYQSVLPMALPAQGIYPANMRATITPIPMNNSSKNAHLSAAINAPPPAPAPVILPSLTDDMFVVEAPSFIVPYVYEKPPVKDLKETVTSIAKELKAQHEREEKERRERKAKGVKTEEDDDDDDDSSCDSKDSKLDAPKNSDKTNTENDKKNVLTDIEKRIEDIQKEAERKATELDETTKKATTSTPSGGNSYFKSALGKFFVDIGHSLVQEFVQNDLLRQQKRKRERESGKNPETNKTINSLIKNLEYTKENNEPYHLKLRKCESCSFKTESKLAMSLHLETPHMKNFVYKCNFCTYEVRSPHDILFHMEAEHNVRGRLERAAAFHQCPSCPFEDNQKGKLSRHMVACARKFKPERNMDPPLDWEPPAKIPRVPRMKQSTLSGTAAMYQAMAKSPQFQLMQKMQSAASAAQQNSALNRGRGRPTMTALGKQTSIMRNPANMLYKNPMAGGSVLLPTTYQVSGNQLYQVVGQEMGGRIGTGGPMTFLPNLSSATGSLTIQSAQNKSKPVHQPSISITPLPRNPTSAAPGAAGSSPSAGKPGDSNSKNSFVICEICDGYIKDLEQLRNHMQWIHKVKIHPKMIYNRPPLNCQKCQFRFFTDQGLERHLLGSHGLVTSSMQEAANKSKDAGRCPVCGRVYQWKLLNHVARDHNMTLKPAHLSYKCTVCTATFGMYKQFENHVYSAHSVVAKRVMDKKTSSGTATASPQNNSAAAKSSNNDSLLKPLKINDEITIIPQMPKGGPSSSSTAAKEEHSTRNSISVTATPGTSKNELSRAERLARRKSGLDN